MRLPTATKYAHPAEVMQAIARAAGGLTAAEENWLGSHVPAGASVLNLGCGAGREASALSRRGCRVVAVDSAWPVLLAAGRGHAGPCRPTWLLADAQHLPFGASARFEVALLIDQFIEHFPARETRVGLLRAVSRRLRAGGLMLLTTHNRLWDPGIARVVYALYRRWLSRPPRGAAARGLPSPARGPRRSGDARARPAPLWPRLHAYAWVRCQSAGRLLARTFRREGSDAADHELEPGSFWLSQVSPARSPGLIAFHPYRGAELATEAKQAGLSVVSCHDAIELATGRPHPRWLRGGAPLLYWVLRREA